MNFLRDFGGTIRIEIADAHFEELKTAKLLVMEAIAVEEKFDAIMENYVELEGSIAKMGLEHLAFGWDAKSTLHMKRNLISRRLINLLSSIRLYKDALRSHAKKMLPQAAFDSILSATRDGPHQPMPYRIMEAVRDFSQHQDFPVAGLTLAGRREIIDATNQDHRFVYTISPKLNGPAIAASRRQLPADVKSELLALGNESEVMPIVRMALERWGAIHGAFRTAIASLTDHSKIRILEAVETVTGSSETSTRLVLAERQNEAGDITDDFQLFDEMFSMLEVFQSKNGSQANLSRRYVASSASL